MTEKHLTVTDIPYRTSLVTHTCLFVRVTAFCVNATETGVGGQSEETRVLLKRRKECNRDRMREKVQ